MATYHLAVTARAPRHRVAGSEHYEAAIYDLTIEVDKAIGRCIATSAWLRKGFPAGCAINIQFQPYEGDEPLIEKPRSKNRGGPKEIVCTIGIPVGWFTGGHGVPAIRLLRAVLQVLGVVGRNFGLGPPQLRGRSAKAAPDPFQPPVRQSPFAAAGAELDRIARAAEPGQLVLASGVRNTEVLDALGTIGNETVVKGPNREEIRVWVVRSHR